MKYYKDDGTISSQGEITYTYKTDTKDRVIEMQLVITGIDENGNSKNLGTQRIEYTYKN